MQNAARSDKPLILMDPFPRTEEMLLIDGTEAELKSLGRVESHFGSRAPDAFIDAHLSETTILVGQADMPLARLDKAPKLRAIINVKGNWEPNIDYFAAQARGIYVLSAAPMMAPAVAEYLLGLAIDLGRGITPAHEIFRRGEERYGIAGNRQAYSLYDARVGLIGFGNLGRALVPLLRPFTRHIGVYDPWLSDAYLADQGVNAMTLDAVLSQSKYIFVLAGVTSENEGFLDRKKLELIQPDSAVILGSRAETVAFDDFIEMGSAKRFRAAIDVFPEEPVPVDAAVRRLPNLLLSSHRAGGITASYARMRRALVDDIRQILNGHPPLLLQRAEPRQAMAMRSR
jgi:phosphoglycerate dehydrogenase-like enzyme